MSDLRQKVETRLDGIADDPEKLEQLWTLIDRACGQTKGEWKTVTCKHCNRQGKYFIEIPVVQASIRAFKDLMEMTKGKPPEQHTHRHEFEVTHIRELSNEELDWVIARGEVEDGDWNALPSAASED